MQNFVTASSRAASNLSPPYSWAELWHVWTVLLPRRSITGRIVIGKVWRRHDGRGWIYKRFSEYGDPLRDA